MIKVYTLYKAYSETMAMAKLYPAAIDTAAQLLSKCTYDILCHALTDASGDVDESHISVRSLCVSLETCNDSIYTYAASGILRYADELDAWSVLDTNTFIADLTTVRTIDVFVSAIWQRLTMTTFEYITQHMNAVRRLIPDSAHANKILYTMSSRELSLVLKDYMVAFLLLNGQDLSYASMPDIVRTVKAYCGEDCQSRLSIIEDTVDETLCWMDKLTADTRIQDTCVWFIRAVREFCK